MAHQARLVGGRGAQAGDRRLRAGDDAADSDRVYLVVLLVGGVLCHFDAGLRSALDDGAESASGHLPDRLGRFGERDERDGCGNRNDYRDLPDRMGFRPLLVQADSDRGQSDSTAGGCGRAHARPQQPRNARRRCQPDLKIKAQLVMVFGYLSQATRRCHGLAPWSLRLAATSTTALLKMPRACPVESHVDAYRSIERETPGDKPVASGNPGSFVATSLRLHGTSPWSLRLCG